MALASRVYFNAVFGGLGGLVGWMLFGVLGGRAPSALAGGALIRGGIRYFLVGREAVRDRALLRFARLAAFGVVFGAAGGALGMAVGEGVHSLLVGWLGAGRDFRHLCGTMLARGLGWMLLGAAVGLGEGVAARSPGKVSYGALGGALGGFAGGALSDLGVELSRDAAE